MPVRKAKAKWNGTLKEGRGQLKLGSGAFEGKYSFQSRFEEGTGTNPEELIGAAHAGCFAMALSNILEEEGYAPEEINAVAQVKLEKTEAGFKIPSIELTASGRIPGIEEEIFVKKAKEAKDNCPVSQAISDQVKISLKAELL